MSSETYWTALLLKVRLVEIAIAQDNHLSRFAFITAGFCATTVPVLMKQGKDDRRTKDTMNRTMKMSRTSVTSILRCSPVAYTFISDRLPWDRDTNDKAYMNKTVKTRRKTINLMKSLHETKYILEVLFFCCDDWN